MSARRETGGGLLARIMASLTRGSFPRFLAVGGFFALVYAGLAALLTGALPLPSALSAALAWVICIPPAWYCHRRFSFGGDAARSQGGLLYFLSQLFSIAIASGAGALFARAEFGHDMVVYLAASGLAAVASYAIARLVIFAPAA